MRHWLLLCAASIPLVTGRASDSRIEIPTEAAQKSLASKVHQTFKAEYERATSAADQIGLAQQLISAAKTASDSELRYTLLIESCRLLLGAGQWKEVLSTIDEVSDHYAIDGLLMKGKSLRAALKKCAQSEATDLSEVAQQLGAHARREKRYAESHGMLRIAYDASLKSRNQSTITAAKEQLQNASELLQIWRASVQAERTLESVDSDPAACLAKGKGLCILEDRWELGIRYLQGSSGPWGKLATSEFETGKSDLKERMTLADAWADAAQSVSGMEKQAMNRRATYWYQIVAQQGDELESVKAGKRLAELRGPQRIERQPKGFAALVNAKDRSKLAAKPRDPPIKTEAAGGPGGEPFEFQVPPGAQLVGLRISSFSPIKFICPIYRTAEGTALGPVIGEEINQYHDVVAQRGFILGGISISHKEFVTAIRLTFQEAGKRRGRWYNSSWYGPHDGRERTVQLGSTDHIVVGLFGNAEALVDSIGLVMVPK